jgi:hypothetical protein
MPITTAICREGLTQREEDAQLRLDFAAFAQRCFRELNPLTPFATAAAFGRKTACITGRCAVAVWLGWQTLFQTTMFASKPSSGARFGRVN